MTMRMLPGETLVGAVSRSPGSTSGSELLTGTRSGALVRLDGDGLRRCQRGDLGEMALRLPGEDGTLDPLVAVCQATEIVGVITSKSRHGRLQTASISDDLNHPADLTLKPEEVLLQLIPLLT